MLYTAFSKLRRDSSVLDLRFRPRNRDSRGPVTPRPRWWRYRFVVLFIALALIAGALLIWQPWRRCGAGLMSDESPSVCVGLDLDSTPFGSADPLSDLEQTLAAQNAQITDNFVTVVMLDNMTSDPAQDSVAAQTVRHAVEGAMTGQWRANHENAADGLAKNPNPTLSVRIHLLLANYGSDAASEGLAVQQIEAARNSQHIVAVVDFGQSRDETREAARALSDDDILDVGSLVTGDDMNEWPSGHPIQRFYRIAPDNTEEATAAVSVLPDTLDGTVAVVYDTNPTDSYALTLHSAFDDAFTARYHQQPLSIDYTSPDVPLQGTDRSADMTSLFGQAVHDYICRAKPKWIYFAGRGVDMSSFLTALSPVAAGGGSCGLPPTTVITGDDATAILANPLPDFGQSSVNVIYTGVATANEWSHDVPGSPNQQDTISYQENYENFVDAFTGRRGGPVLGTMADLPDGYAIINQDAVLTAATAARDDYLPVLNPETVADAISNIDCANPVPGAGGYVAFGPNSRGNTIDRPIPIIHITPSGGADLSSIAWSTGAPFDADAPGCG